MPLKSGRGPQSPWREKVGMMEKFGGSGFGAAEEAKAQPCAPMPIIFLLNLQYLGGVRVILSQLARGRRNDS